MEFVTIFNMKILGRANERFFIASAAHYDCRTHDGMMVDGGAKGCHDYAGYNRFGGDGKTCWAEIPITFADFYNDYRLNSTSSRAVRKYGIWPLSEAKILEKEDWPDIESLDWKIENAIWGTRGKNGDEPLKYISLKDAETSHLEAILELKYASEYIKEVINKILDGRGRS